MSDLTVKKFGCVILRWSAHEARPMSPEPMALATGATSPSAQPVASAIGSGNAPVASAIGSGLILFVGVLFFGSLLCQPVFGEGPVKVDIALGTSALKDPLIEVVLPPKGSMDTLSFRPDGILIQQVADQPGVKTGVTGIKLLSNVEGDFSFQLDFDAIKLARPRKGWGQGLVIRILTDDKNAPIMAFGCVATLQSDRMYWINLQRGAGKPPDQIFLPSDFKSGTWTVAREGSEIVLSVLENQIAASGAQDGAVATKKGILREVARRPCTTATLQGIHVWSVRQESGNTEAEFLLRRLRLTADSFFSFKETPKTAYWVWVLTGIVVVSSIAGIVVVVRRTG